MPPLFLRMYLNIQSSILVVTSYCKQHLIQTVTRVYSHAVIIVFSSHDVRLLSPLLSVLKNISLWWTLMNKNPFTNLSYLFKNFICDFTAPDSDSMSETSLATIVSSAHELLRKPKARNFLW